MQATASGAHREAWNKGKLVGQNARTKPSCPAPYDESMKHRVWVPIGFSAAYLVGAWIVGYYGSSGTWEALARAIGIFVALVFVAVPSILLIWLAWAWWSRGQTLRPLGVLVAAGLTIPFAVAAVGFAIFAAGTAVDRSRTAHQLSNAHLSEVTDDVLLSPRGNPIGIRLRYTVRFNEGLDDVRYRPMVSLGFASRYVVMWRLRSETDPIVEGSFGKHEYRITDDFVPMYFPGFMRFPDAPQRADDRCFEWGGASYREAAKNIEAEHATIDVSFASSPDNPVSRRTSSSLAYAQNTFYNGALSEGARECP